VAAAVSCWLRIRMGRNDRRPVTPKDDTLGGAMTGLAFISYRRDDTREIAQALYLQLKQDFGAGQLFMDVNPIRAGEACRLEQSPHAPTD
jgi:hypothetical protein